MVKSFFLGSLLFWLVACGDSEPSSNDGHRAGSAGSSALGGGGGSRAGSSNAGSSTTSGGTGGARGGRDGSGGTGTPGAGEAGMSGDAGDGGDAGGTVGAAGGSGAGHGGSAGTAAGMGGGSTTVGPRCLDCETLCVDDALAPPEPLETCTEPSPFSGLGVSFDLAVTLPDGSKRYLVDSPFDYDSDNYPSWSFDSLGTRWFKQPLVCGEVAASGLSAGTLDAESAQTLSVKVDNVEYRSDIAPASVTLEAGQTLQALTDQDLGPLFDLVASGTLVSETGAAIELTGHMRNVSAGLGERGLPRYVAPSGGVLDVQDLLLSGEHVVAGPISVNAGTTGALVLDGGLGNAETVSLSDHVLRLSAFPDGGWLGSGNLDNFLVAFETSGSERWRTPVFDGDWLFTTYETPLARADGSGCLAVGGPSFADPERPAMLACSDAEGGFAFQSAVFPVIEPLSPTELEDGTVVLLDARSPEVQGYAPDGTQRFAFAPCTPPPSGAQTPYFSRTPAARDLDGGAVASLGEDIVAFRADGTLRFRSLVPQSHAEPLVAADGTIYVLAGGNLGLVALDHDGELKWNRPLGGSGSLVGLAEDGTIYAVTSGWHGYGLLTAVRSDGSVAWSAQTTLRGWRLAPNGDLYGFDSGLLEHVRGDSPMADAPWPTPRGSARRAGTR